MYFSSLLMILKSKVMLKATVNLYFIDHLCWINCYLYWPVRFEKTTQNDLYCITMRAYRVPLLPCSEVFQTENIPLFILVPPLFPPPSNDGRRDETPSSPSFSSSSSERERERGESASAPLFGRFVTHFSFPPFHSPPPVKRGKTRRRRGKTVCVRATREFLFRKSERGAAKRSTLLEGRGVFFLAGSGSAESWLMGALEFMHPISLRMYGKNQKI